MKIKRLFMLGILAVTVLFLSGCATSESINRETYNLLVSYQQELGKKCLKYMVSDTNLSARDKNGIKNYDRLYTNMLSTIKIND